MLTALVLMVVVGSALPPRDAPSLGGTEGGDFDVSVPVLESTPGDGTRATRAAATRPSALPPTKRIVDDRVPTLHVRVNRGGRTIARFDDVLRCAGKVTLANIAIDRDGRFQVKRQLWSARRSVVVSLAGKIDERRVVRGTVHASRGRCQSGLVHFWARAQSE